MKPIGALVILLFMSSVYCFNKSKNSKNVNIIGGKNISIEKVAFMVSVRLNATYHWCGGSIIHKQFILTAAHCIVPNIKYKVLVGTDKVNEGGKLYDVENIIIHKLYSNKTNDYDICILKLNETLTFGPTVNKIDLIGNLVKLKRKTMLQATGWGYTRPEGKISQNLKQVTIPMVSRLSCQFTYGRHRKITPRMLCAGRYGMDTCTGDSGGPLTWNNLLVGVTSFGSGCGEVPGVYTRLSILDHWIKDIIE